MKKLIATFAALLPALGFAAEFEYDDAAYAVKLGKAMEEEAIKYGILSPEQVLEFEQRNIKIQLSFKDAYERNDEQGIKKGQEDFNQLVDEIVAMEERVEEIRRRSTSALCEAPGR